MLDLTLLLQILQGIDFIHQNEIAHGDVQPGNVLFGLKDMTSVDENDLVQSLKPRNPEDSSNDAGVSEPVQRLDGKPDKWAPRYLALDQPLVEHADVDPQFAVKISDMGAAFTFSDPHSEPITPIGLRSSECMCGAQVNQNQDVWSFGCLIYEFLTGIPLFVVAGYDHDEEEDQDDEHFLQFSGILGPLPQHILSRWPRANLYYDSEGRQREKHPEKPRNEEGSETELARKERAEDEQLPGGHVDGDTPGDHLGGEAIPGDDHGGDNDSEDAYDIPPLLSLEGYFNEYKRADVSDKEAAAITELIRLVLQYDPKKRPSAVELLKHPWFAEEQTV